MLFIWQVMNTIFSLPSDCLLHVVSENDDLHHKDFFLIEFCQVSAASIHCIISGQFPSARLCWKFVCDNISLILQWMFVGLCCYIHLKLLILIQVKCNHKWDLQMWPSPVCIFLPIEQAEFIFLNFFEHWLQVHEFNTI